MATARSAPPLSCYVLHAWDWSESSLILDLFTRPQGRVVAVAKGAKKPTSALRPLLMPFHALAVWLARPGADDGEVRAVRAVEWGGSAALPGTALMSGFYLNELLLKGLPRQDAHPALFDAYADTLAALAAASGGGGDEAAALRAFELVLLRELGLLPELGVVTLTADAVEPGGAYLLQAEQGLAPAAGGIEGRAWTGLEAALGHRDADGGIAALRAACRPLAAALRPPLRALVQYHLASGPLRTRQLGLELQRLADPAPR
ncbi:MAG: DNA repair protein RecO [Pseudomonadota bacterium]|jgi:DNA repair protein RecO (recombination protein O)|nr:DNA repair protein RecO [Rubrivivax sp.]MCA3258362.1 DNA repair protein RecO [Rubrivivax sp.]MCE2911460.1 DNA repair protein RecO [Rubrivivax sp.]MCZ8031686.1 DNA repair protein RecO [Rubrivivax sp.]